MTSTSPNQRNRMARTQASTLVVGVCIGLALGWTFFGQESPTPLETPVAPVVEVASSVPHDAPSTTPEPAEAKPEISEPPLHLPPLSVPPLSARHLFVYLGGSELTPREAASLREFCPGGVVLRDENIESAEQTRALIRAIQRTTGAARRPVIALDASPEGYRRLGLDMVMRFEDLGLLNNPQALREAGRRRGDVARGVGLEVIFAPPLDVFVPGLSDETLRSNYFSEDADQVAEMGLAFAEGVKDAGAIPVARHFPGLGLVEVNDVGRSVILVSDKNELADLISPFDKAVAAGIPGMIVTHAEMTAIDAGIPATQSHALLGALVRQKWGYEGVLLAQGILTHPMTAGLAPEEAVVLALSAGCDAVIIEDVDRRILHRVCNAMDSAENKALLPESRRAASRTRIDAWRLAMTVPEEVPAPAPPTPTVEPEPARVIPEAVAPVESEPEPPMPEAMLEAPPELEVSPTPKTMPEVQPELETSPESEATVETPAEAPLEPAPATSPSPEEEPAGPAEPTDDEAQPEPEATVTESEPVDETAPTAPESTETTAAPATEEEVPLPTEVEAVEADSKADAETDADEGPPGTVLLLHRIEQGESLLGIAKQYGVLPGDVRRWNGMDDDTIKYGFNLKVYLPVATEPPAADAAATPELQAVTEAPEATAKVEATERPADAVLSTYTVVNGDRLRLIAEKHGTTIERLMVLNKIEDPDHVWVGQKLKIPQNDIVGGEDETKIKEQNDEDAEVRQE